MTAFAFQIPSAVRFICGSDATHIVERTFEQVILKEYDNFLDLILDSSELNRILEDPTDRLTVRQFIDEVPEFRGISLSERQIYAITREIKSQWFKLQEEFWTLEDLTIRDFSSDSCDGKKISSELRPLVVHVALQKIRAWGLF